MNKEKWDIEVAESDSVASVKGKVKDSKDEFKECDLGGFKLIHKGKILNDKDSIGSAEIGENHFLVVIPGKKVAAPAPVVNAAEAASAATGSETPAAAANEGQGAGAGPTAPHEAVPATNNSENSAVINSLCDMGFERSQCEAALRAAYGNPDRAVEYLMSGIPAGLDGPPPAPAGGDAQAAAPVAPAGPVPNAGDGFSGEAFPGVMPGAGAGAPGGGMPGLGAGGAPNMAALQAALTQNPEMLNQIIAQIAQSNPEMIPMLQQNPQMMMQLLAGMAGGGMPGMEGMGAGMPGAGGEAGAMPAPPAGEQVAIPNLTADEQAAVERLTGLGFPRVAAIQAYIAAEKNEELAANLLFDMGEDF